MNNDAWFFSIVIKGRVVYIWLIVYANTHTHACWKGKCIDCIFLRLQIQMFELKIFI